MPQHGESHITIVWYLSKIFPASKETEKENPVNVGIAE